jgi:hypothetical protein
MAVNQNNYDHRGGGNYGIVLRCPNIVADDRLVYFDQNRERGIWVLRDFVGEHKLDHNNSPLSVAQIEADAIYDEFPIWCAVEDQPADWKTYLTLTSLPSSAWLRLEFASTNSMQSPPGVGRECTAEGCARCAKSDATRIGGSGLHSVRRI